MGTFNMPRTVPVGGTAIADQHVLAGVGTGLLQARETQMLTCTVYSQIFPNTHAFRRNFEVWGQDHWASDPNRFHDH